MTDSTATKAASNGGDTTEEHPPAQREHGIKRLREQECYQLTGLILDCLGEAEHVIRKVHNKTFNRILDHDGSKGTHPLDRDEARKILEEGYTCASLALSYIFNASTHLRDASDDEMPPPPF